MKLRKFFSKFPKGSYFAPFDVIKLQKNSFNKYINQNEQIHSLHNTLKNTFSIKNADGSIEINYKNFILEPPILNEDDSLYRCLTYSSKLIINLEILYKNIRYDHQVVINEFPLITSNGHFIINGIRKFVVSHLKKSSGPVFSIDEEKNSFTCKIVPSIGPSITIEISSKCIITFRLTKSKKIPFAFFFMTLDNKKFEQFIDIYKDRFPNAICNENILINFASLFAKKFECRFCENEKEIIVFNVSEDDFNKYSFSSLKNSNISLNKETNSIRIKLEDIAENFLVNHYYYDVAENNKIKFNNEIFQGMPLHLASEKFFKQHFSEVVFTSLFFENKYEIIGINLSHFGINEFHNWIQKNESNIHTSKNKTKTKKVGIEENIVSEEEEEEDQENEEEEILDNIQDLDIFTKYIYKNDNYDISETGRYRIKKLFDSRISFSNSKLDFEDIMLSIFYLIDLFNGKAAPTSIDDLSVRCVKRIGDMIDLCFKSGLIKIKKLVHDSIFSLEDVFSKLNGYYFASEINDLFYVSQSIQFLEQTNILSEVSHKRRLSALGQGGLNKFRAGFEVRDVDKTFYGRICPIETPEGPNIGLINYLSLGAKVNELGFIEAPFLKVIDKKVTEDILFLTCDEELKYTIAIFGSKIENNFLSEDKILCRRGFEKIFCKPEEVDLIEINSFQIVSIASGLIPFLEHNDARRALMGANMQRQALPLLGKPEAPIIGTGLEKVVASEFFIFKTLSKSEIKDENNLVLVNNPLYTVINKVDDDNSPFIFIQKDKFSRTNMNTFKNLTLKCNKNQPINKVKFYDSSIDDCELALGRNILVAFMSWRGYNFEDSIVVSERIVKENILTSLNIVELEVTAKDTEIGLEEITRDIPGVTEEQIRFLDDKGIITIGSYITPGTILVGRIIPKLEDQISQEEKLLRSIFGEKAKNFKDISLRAPYDVEGTVIDVKILNNYSNSDLKKDKILLENSYKIKKANIQRNSKSAIIQSIINKIEIFVNKNNSSINIEELRKNTSIESIKKYIKKFELENNVLNEKILNIINAGEISINNYINDCSNDKENVSIRHGTFLTKTVVKIYVAIKKRLEVGDKLSGRHGNKGVVSKIVSIEDMPFTNEGNIIDIILNPLGIPSRMNIGQVLETHLGFAANKLGKRIKCLLENGDKKEAERLLKIIFNNKEDLPLLNQNMESLLEQCKETGNLYFEVPVFSANHFNEIQKLFELANIKSDGKISLYDGITGQIFERDITVGIQYIMKLNHIAADKMHARSVGPYSIINQQPTSGKAHNGGQRIGEMEVWALIAHGSSNTLREILTIKSDDTIGRVKSYLSLLSGKKFSFDEDASIPESFSVLVRLLNSACLKLDFFDKKKNITNNKKILNSKDGFDQIKEVKDIDIEDSEDSNILEKDIFEDKMDEESDNDFEDVFEENELEDSILTSSNIDFKFEDFEETNDKNKENK